MTLWADISPNAVCVITKRPKYIDISNGYLCLTLAGTDWLSTVFKSLNQLSSAHFLEKKNNNKQKLFPSNKHWNFINSFYSQTIFYLKIKWLYIRDLHFHVH